MIVIAREPSISFPKAAGKKEADERVERFPHPPSGRVVGQSRAQAPQRAPGRGRRTWPRRRGGAAHNRATQSSVGLPRHPLL
jgi:hypothetical protein